MRQRRRVGVLAAGVAAAVWSMACSSSSPPAQQPGTGGTGGAGAGSGATGGGGGAACPTASASVTCTPDLAWYVIAAGVDGGTGAAQPLAPDATTGAHCTSSGLAVDFNAAGSSGGTKGIWDARSYGGVAFDFSGSMIPPHGMRVSFVFAGQGPDGPPWYQGTAQPYSALADGQHVVIHWDAVGGPYGASNPVLFDPDKLQTMQIQALDGAAAAGTQFCVANLAALPD
jgi:hypothetical protein